VLSKSQPEKLACSLIVVLLKLLPPDEEKSRYDGPKLLCA
jgi:hypothetical protein